MFLQVTFPFLKLFKYYFWDGSSSTIIECLTKTKYKTHLEAIRLNMAWLINKHYYLSKIISSTISIKQPI